MTKPSTNPYLWGSDTNFSSGDESGNPVKVDPSGDEAQGFVPGDTFPSQHVNEVLHNLGEWSTWSKQTLENAADGGSTGSDTDLRNVVGVAGRHSLFQIPAVDANDDVDLTGVTAGPTPTTTPGREDHFRREVTTGSSAVTVVSIGDLPAATDSAAILEVRALVIIAGTGISAQSIAQEFVIVSNGGTISGQGNSARTVSLGAGGGSPISGLTLGIGASGNEAFLTLEDSSQPRTVRIAGWMRWVGMRESGSS